MTTWTKEQNEAIYKTGTNIIVSAGAGSGKTAVLSQRVLEKLKKKIHINELLILTFTNKAAEEMKERIRQKIKNDPSLEEELSLLDSAYVTTFDSFLLSLVRKYHYLLNLPPNPKITDESLTNLLKKDTLREVLDSYYESNNQNFTQMINDFCVKNDEEIYNALLKSVNILEKDLNQNEILENYESIYYQEAKIEQIIQEFEEYVFQERDRLQKKLEEFYQIIPNEYRIKCQNAFQNFFQAEDLDSLIFVRSTRFPSLPKNTEEEIKQCKENISRSLKEFQTLLDYGNKEQLKQDYLKMKPYILVCCDILKRYFSTIEKRYNEKGYLDFNEIAKKIIHLLKNNSPICEELKKQFKEIMIDEYQDTNDIQENFISLISNQNVYMVGDIKQSIYRFRNANPYLFKTKYEQYRNHHGGEKIDLLNNFRSRKEVLTNVNLTFNQLMNEEIGGANYVLEHQMIYGNKAYEEMGSTQENYQMELFTYENKKNKEFSNDEIEAFVIAKDIQEKIQKQYQIFDKERNQVHNVSYKDFVILMDRSTNFPLYKKVFNYFQIPLSINQDEKMNQTVCYGIIKNLLNVVNHYNEKKFDNAFCFSLTSIARSFLFEMNDQEIYEMITQKQWYQNPIYEKLKDIIHQFSIISLTELINDIITATEIYQKLIKIGNIKENMQIIAKIQELSNSIAQEGKSSYEFYEFLNRLEKEDLSLTYTIQEDNENSVKMMTIHKSKGLEFPICYFSGLYKKFNIQDIKESFLYNQKYGFITPLKEEGIYSNFIKELMKKDYLKEELSERMRLFYVATTRAKEKMIFVLPEKEKDKEKEKSQSLADFLYVIWPSLKSYQQKIDLEKIKITKDYLLEKVNQVIKNQKSTTYQVTPIATQEITMQKKTYSKDKVKVITKEEYQNMQLGIKIHEYLENIDFQFPNYQIIEDSFLRQKVQNFVESDFLKSYKKDKIYKELEFIMEENQNQAHGIIDLLIETPTKWVIVDYKLNNVMDKAYKNQLKGYQEFVSKRSPKPVETYLYSILKEEIIPITNLE